MRGDLDRVLAAIDDALLDESWADAARWVPGDGWGVDDEQPCYGYPDEWAAAADSDPLPDNPTRRVWVRIGGIRRVP